MDTKLEQFCFYEDITPAIVKLMKAMFNEKYLGFIMCDKDRYPIKVQHTDRTVFTFFNNRKMAEAMLIPIQPKSTQVGKITLSDFLKLFAELKASDSALVGNVAIVLPSRESYENLKKNAEKLGLEMASGY